MSSALPSLHVLALEPCKSSGNIRRGVLGRHAVHPAALRDFPSNSAHLRLPPHLWPSSVRPLGSNVRRRGSALRPVVVFLVNVGQNGDGRVSSVEPGVLVHIAVLQMARTVNSVPWVIAGVLAQQYPYGAVPIIPSNTSVSHHPQPPHNQPTPPPLVHPERRDNKVQKWRFSHPHKVCAPCGLGGRGGRTVCRVGARERA